MGGGSWELGLGLAAAAGEGRSCARGACVSTMKAEESMSDQLTGMPWLLSAEPHRPGAISRHLRPSARSSVLTCSGPGSGSGLGSGSRLASGLVFVFV